MSLIVQAHKFLKNTVAKGPTKSWFLSAAQTVGYFKDLFRRAMFGVQWLES